MKTIYLIPPCLLISACNLIPVEPEPYEEVIREFSEAASSGDLGEIGLDAQESLDALSNAKFTPAPSIPDTGSAMYFGHLALGTPQDGALGELSMSIDFNNTSISGQANNFIDEYATPIDGQFEIFGGSINRNADPELDWQFEVSLDGNLEWNGIDSSSYGQLVGDFYDGDSVIGGEANIQLLDDAADTSYLTGGFSVIKQ